MISHTVNCIMNCLHDCEDWPCFRGDDLVDMRVGNSTSEDGCDGRNGDFWGERYKENLELLPHKL